MSNVIPGELKKIWKVFCHQTIIEDMIISASLSLNVKLKSKSSVKVD